MLEHLNFNALVSIKIVLNRFCQRHAVYKLTLVKPAVFLFTGIANVLSD